MLNQVDTNYSYNEPIESADQKGIAKHDSNLFKIMLFTVLAFVVMGLSVGIGILIGKQQASSDLKNDQAQLPSNVPPIPNEQVNQEYMDQPLEEQINNQDSKPTYNQPVKNDEEEIRRVVSEAGFASLDPEWQDGQTEIKVGEIEIVDNFSIGTLNFNRGGGGGPGYVWIAKKINGQWQQIWGGQEEPLCSEIEQYQVPTSISTCYKP